MSETHRRVLPIVLCDFGSDVRKVTGRELTHLGASRSAVLGGKGQQGANFVERRSQVLRRLATDRIARAA
jgi:hypothetical protein